MPLHPQCRAFLDQLAAAGGRALHEMTPAEARAMAMPPDLSGPEQPVHQVENRRVPGDGGPIAVRILKMRKFLRRRGTMRCETRWRICRGCCRERMRSRRR